MKTQKNYVVDTNVLLDDPYALEKLHNCNENKVFIPYHVLLELNKFKKDSRLGHIVSKFVQSLTDHPDQYQVLKSNGISKSFADLVDNYILDEIKASDLREPILVTNDRLFQLQAGLKGIRSEDYRESAPFQPEAEFYTGFIDGQEKAAKNYFRWNEH